VFEKWFAGSTGDPPAGRLCYQQTIFQTRSQIFWSPLAGQMEARNLFHEAPFYALGPLTSYVPRLHNPKAA